MSHDYPRHCCPYLRASAEADALQDLGVTSDSFGTFRSVLIGRLRQLHGCPGPSREGFCYYNYSVNYGANTMDHKAAVPEVRPPKPDDGREMPGANL